MKQRMLSALLAASMVLTMAPAAFAADAAEGEQESIDWGANNTYELGDDTTLRGVYTISGDTYTIDLDTHTLTVDTIQVKYDSGLTIKTSGSTGTRAVAALKDNITFQVGGKLTLGQNVTFNNPVYVIQDDTAATLAAIPQIVSRAVAGEEDENGTVTLEGGNFTKGLTVSQPTTIPAGKTVEGTITVNKGASLTVAGEAGTIVANDGATIDVTGTVAKIQIVEGTQPTINAAEGAVKEYEIVTEEGAPKTTYQVTMDVKEGGSAELYSQIGDAEKTLAPAVSENSNVYLISNDAKIIVAVHNEPFYKVENVTLTADTTGAAAEALTYDANVLGFVYNKALAGNATIAVTFAKDDSDGTDQGGSGSSGGGSSSSSNKPSVSVSGAGGKVTASSNGTVTITPDEGYEIAKITVNGKEVAIPADGKLTGLTKNDKVVVTFAKITDGSSTLFADVADDAWYADAVRYVYEKGMMNGTSSTTFSPNETTTRAMIVTMLHRLENEPTASAAGFTDVASNTYYANAVAWAAANGVVTGVSETSFAPNDAITREQLAAILYRYAELKGYNVSASGSLSGYTDASQISSYATTAMQWANSTGLITGKTSTTLSPKGNATRAEVATILIQPSSELTEST